MTMKINEVSFEFDIFEEKDSENYDKAIENLSLEEAAIVEAQASGKAHNMVKAMNHMFRTFFKTATGIDVLATCTNVNKSSEAYYDFVSTVGKSQAYVFEKYDAKRVR